MSSRSYHPRALLRRSIRVLIIIFIVLLVILGGGLLFTGIKSHQTLVLPAPTGPYAIGRVSYDWVDHLRVETFAPQKGAKRELFVWVWYPAERLADQEPANYLPPKWAQAWNQYHGGSFPTDLLLQRADSIRVHAVANAAISIAQTHYPVLIFEPGMGALPTDYTTLIEDIVSHGYVVVGITPTYSASVVVFPDGRTVKAVPAAQGESSTDSKALAASFDQIISIWSNDAIFVMNQLTTLNADSQSVFAGHLDLTRIGLFGHSFGGATAAEVCHLDARCKAGIDLDGSPFGEVIQQGLTKPFLFIHHDFSSCSDQICTSFLLDARSILRPVPDGKKFMLAINGTKHANFADYAVMFSPLRFMGVLGSIDGQRGLQITGAYIRAFFDTYLNHTPSPLLQGLSPVYPEVQFETP